MISNNGYIDKLDDLVDKHNNTYHKTIKIRSIYVKITSYIDFDIETNDRDFKF